MNRLMTLAGGGVFVPLILAACSPEPAKQVDCNPPPEIMSYMKDGTAIYAEPEPTLGGQECMDMAEPEVRGEEDVVRDDSDRDQTSGSSGPSGPSGPSEPSEPSGPSEPSDPGPGNNGNGKGKGSNANNGGGNGSEGSSPGKGSGANVDE